jgi:hypothetical protein
LVFQVHFAAYFAVSWTPKREPVDGFEFGITHNYDADQDSIRLPRKFGEVVDVRMN